MRILSRNEGNAFSDEECLVQFMSEAGLAWVECCGDQVRKKIHLLARLFNSREML